MKQITKSILLAAIVIFFALAGCDAPQPTTTTKIPTSIAASATQMPITTEAMTLESPTAAEPTIAATGSTPDASGAGNNTAAENLGNLKFTIVSDISQANYRVREQLASLNLPSDAMGKTNSISGSITIQPDGTIVASESQIVVDVSNLTSDSSRRDNYVRRNILQTDQFPQVTFVPQQVTGLQIPPPQSGEIAFQLSGDLTIRDVTRPVTWEITGQIQNEQIIAKATTTFTFEDFNLTQPRVPVVLSVEDKITLEADLVLQQ
jgi:polyisoprenoid-binding protein YceI